MAYLKYKELAQYFNFFDKLDIKHLPKYVTDYMEDDEIIYAAYATYRDKCVFTDKKILLLDQKGIFGKKKKIHIFPYCSISSSAIEYNGTKTAILLSMDSGYQLRLNFVKMSAENKTELRKIYFKLIENIENKVQN